MLALIGTPSVLQGIDRLMRDPTTSLPVLQGMNRAEASLRKPRCIPRQDHWWRQPGFRGDANHLPILMIDSFFDVESRGAFQAYQRLRGDGAHLLVSGAHDGAPKGTNGGVQATSQWFEHYLRGVPNGVRKQRRVRVLLSDGDREDYLDGKFLRRGGNDWPLPGTHWQRLFLSPRKSGSANSLNDGSLTLGRPATEAIQSYAAAPTLPTNTDPPNTAIIGPSGVNELSAAFPLLTEMTLSEPLGLGQLHDAEAGCGRDRRRTCSPRREAVEQRPGDRNLGRSLKRCDLPGRHRAPAHRRTAEQRLSADQPQALADRSAHRRDRAAVQPLRAQAAGAARHLPPLPGRAVARRQSLPRAGDRIRLDIVGASAASLPSAPGVNRVQVGGTGGSSLQLPLLRSSDLAAALP